jgi:serine/threonine protein kinase/alpha-tubulin suppressor-like RCC1 family protein/uncharacterized protein YjdB
MTDPLRCTRCGFPLAPGSHFCSKCGFDVSGEQGGIATSKMTAIPPTGEAPDPQAALLEEVRHSTVGEFEIYNELGHGGMASVFLAHEIALDRKVAIKVMSPSLLQSGRSMAERFKREAQTAARLSHPHIIPIYAVRESGRLLYFVMKYVQGRSLDVIIKQHGALPIKMVQAILAQVGSALDYAHRNNVIHRDIKPANIMLDVDGWAVITDFGIAKATQEQGLTMTGATIGTPTYMSPEQCAAKTKDISGATDQYSLGIAAYEMLSGTVPFDADSVMGLMWHHFYDPPPPLRERRPDCPEEIIQAIERMLAKKPADRWPTLEEAVGVIGAPPHNDPIRREMKAMARGGTGQRLLAEHHTPSSPLPPDTAAPTTPLPSSPLRTPTPPTPPAPVTSQPSRTPAPPSTPPPVPPAPTVAETPPPASISTAPTTALPPPPRAAPTPPPPSRPAPRAPARPTAPDRRGRRGLWIGLAVVAAAAGIGGWLLFGHQPPAPTPVAPPTPAPPAPVATVVITPTPASIPVGRTAQLKAVLTDSAGHPLARDVRWASSDTAMARVSASGLVTGVAPGTVNVSAISEGQTGLGTVIVTATAVPVARVDIEPGAASVPLGDSVTLAAAPKDADGNTLSGHAVTWTSGDRAVAPVSAAGTVVGLREGNAQILAVVDGKRATARVTVTPARVAAVTLTPASVTIQVGERQQLTVGARAARGHPLSGRAVSWSSSDPRVAVINADGAVVGVSPGQATVSAEVESRRQTATVTVAPVPVASVAVVPARLTVAVGEHTALAVSARDARGRALQGREARWSSSDPTVAQISADGVVTGLGAGSTVITAAIEGKTASASVTVPAPPAPPPVVAAQPAPTPAPPTQPAEPGAGAPPAAEPAAPARTLPRRDVAAGGAFSCGITDEGTAVCWGSNTAGQTGEAGAGARATNPVVVPSTRGLTSVVAGDAHACGLTESGGAVCWGSNAKGQLGAGRTSGPPTPGAVKGNLTFTALAAGAQHTCGLTASGAAWCWGDNNRGQLGEGSTRGANVPQRVKSDAKFKFLAAGSSHTCGLTQTGQVWCWGDGFSGQLGRGTRETVEEPVQANLDGRAIALAAAGEHTCALLQGGSAFCWGANKAGEIGDGSRSERDRPVAVSGGQRFVSITAGDAHTCALTAGGDAYCWGRDRTGQLGNGATADRQTPVRVGFDRAFQSISAGATHTCGVTREQVVVCWGGNASGQLGDGSMSNRATPAPVQAAAGRP